MQDRSLYRLLALAGAMPFLAGALLPWFGVDAVGPIGPLDSVVSSYALAIISFLAGAHWATFIYRAAQAPFNLLVTSNLVLLVVWFVYVGAGVGWQLLTELLAFLFLLFVDHRLLRAGSISGDYFATRAIATALAAVSLLAILLSS